MEIFGSFPDCVINKIKHWWRHVSNKKLWLTSDPLKFCGLYIYFVFYCIHFKGQQNLIKTIQTWSWSMLSNYFFVCKTFAHSFYVKLNFIGQPQKNILYATYIHKNHRLWSIEYNHSSILWWNLFCFLFINGKFDQFASVNNCKTYVLKVFRHISIKILSIVFWLYNKIHIFEIYNNTNLNEFIFFLFEYKSRRELKSTMSIILYLTTSEKVIEVFLIKLTMYSIFKLSLVIYCRYCMLRPLYVYF